MCGEELDGVLFMGHRQTVEPQMGGYRMQFLAHQIEKSYVLPHVRNSFLTYLYHKDRKIPAF